MTLISIHKLHPKAECFMTRKETHAVEFSTGDGPTVVVALNEFIKLLRLELKKAERTRSASDVKRAKEPSKQSATATTTGSADRSVGTSDQ